MRAEDIRHTQQAAPVQPFTVHLADGRIFAVRHRDFLWIAPSGRRLMIENMDGNMEIVDPMLVTSLSVPAEPVQSQDR